jgi:uncharacterized membrane protein YccC
MKYFPIDLHAISVTEGLRAGIAVAVTVLAGELFGLPYFGLAALGALLTCFADPGGPVARRAPAVIAFALCSGVVYAAFGLVRDESLWVAAPLAALMIFGASFARIYGQGGLQVGNLLSVVTVLALDRPAGDFVHAAGLGLNLMAGAAWAAVLTLLLWRIHPYRPAREALAAVAVALSRLAKELAALANADETVAAFEAHAATHRRAVREAIEAARIVALEIFKRRGLVTQRAAQVSVRLQSLEQIFAGLIALSDILDAQPAARGPCTPALRLLAGWLAAFGPDFIADRDVDTPKRKQSLNRFRAVVAVLEDSPQQHVLAGMAEHLAVLITISAPDNEPAANPMVPLGRKIFAPIAQNLNFSSAALRHALRAAFVAGPALAWTMTRPDQFAHWATITMVLCLQPYFSATWQRSAERIAGTALGGVLAAGIGVLTQTSTELAITMLPLTIFAFAMRAVSYGVFVAALTPMIVLLVEQIAPGANELTIAVDRVGYTLLGGLLAVLANLLLWPGFEGGRVEAGIKTAMDAHAAYAKAVFAALLEGGAPADAARRAAGLASNNLEAILSRALLEPHKSRDPAISRGAIVDAALRRVAGSLSLLLLDPPASTENVAPWRDFLLAGLSGAPIPRPRLAPPGPVAETLMRLARQVELLNP